MTERFLAQIKDMDHDRDMAGVVAIERTLLFLQAVRKSHKDNLTMLDMLTFLLLTGPIASTGPEAADLMGINPTNMNKNVRKLIVLGYMEESIKGGPNGGRRKGKMIATTYRRTEKGKSFALQRLATFSTRDFGLISDMIDGNEVKVNKQYLVKQRKELIDNVKDLPIDY